MRLGCMLTKGFLGQFSTAVNGADHTTAIQFGLEAHFDAVRIIIPNSVTATITGVKARVSAAGAAGASNSSTAVAPSDGSWPNITWAGSSSVTLPAGTSGDDPSWTVSDWVTVNSLDRTDGGTQPLLHVRIFIPAANANRPAWIGSALASSYANLATIWAEEAQCAGRLVRCRTQAVNGVDTLGNLTIGGSASDYLCVPVIVQYASRVNGITVMVAGDSIDEKAGGNGRRGWQDIAQAAVSTTSAPVEFCTVAIGGSNSTTWRTRAEKVIAAVQPDYCMFPGFEVNDTATPMTAANIKTMRGNIERMRAISIENMAVPIMRTGIPSTATGGSGKNWDSSDSLRIALNNERRALRGALVCDFDASLAGTADADGQIQFANGLSDDGLHPNDAGHQRLATERVVPLLNSLLSANGLLA